MVDPPLWPEKRYGAILGKVVDRERIARCLDAFNDETAILATDGQNCGLFVYTPDWIVDVMPVRDEPSEGLPAFAA